MAKNFQDFTKTTMDYWAKYIGLSKNQSNVVPYGWSVVNIKPKKIKRRDPSRRW